MYHASALDQLETELCSVAAKSQARLTRVGGQPSQLEWAVDAPVGVCRIGIRRAQAERPCLARGAALQLEYQLPRGTARPSAGLLRLLEALAAAAVAARHAGVAELLGAERPSASELLRLSPVDLVRRGARRAAIITVPANVSPADPSWFEGVRVALSRFRIHEDLRGHPARARRPGAGRRFAYLSDDLDLATRLRDADEGLHAPGWRGRSNALQARAVRDVGELLGYPPCCVERFVQRRNLRGHRDELHTCLQRLGWSGREVDARLNFLACALWKIPVCVHVPCGEGCVPSLDGAERVLALHTPSARHELERVLSTSLLVFGSGQVLPFRAVGGQGETLDVEQLGDWPWPELLSEAAGPRQVGSEHFATSPGSVRQLGLRGGEVQVRADGGWIALQRRRWSEPWWQAPLIARFRTARC